MAKRRQPTAEDAAEVRRVALAGVRADAGLDQIFERLAPLHPEHNEFPGTALLELAADAIELSGADRGSPLEFEQIRERFLPECSAHTKAQHHKSKWTIRAAAMIRGGVDPGIGDELYFWRSDDFWAWCLDALMTWVRAAADHAGVTTPEMADRIARKHDLVFDDADLATWLAEEIAAG